MDDLTSLREGLTTLQLPRDPPRSITRLVTAIQDARTLTKLRLQIQDRETELQTLQGHLATAQGELDGYQKHVLATLNTAHAEHQAKFEKLLAMVDEHATTATQRIQQHILTIKRSIEDVRDHAAVTGETIQQLEALRARVIEHHSDDGASCESCLTADASRRCDPADQRQSESAARWSRSGGECNHSASCTRIARIRPTPIRVPAD